MLPAGTDNEIISQILAGRTECFALLVKRYQQDTYRLALSILRNTSDAEDAVSEAFSKAYAALPRNRDYPNFKGWLLKITSNCCQDILRLRKREVRDEIAANHIDSAVNSNPLQSLVLAEDKRRIWQALGCLNPDDRTAVVMKYCQETSYEDIAAVLRCPPGTVASRLFRSREKMRKIMVGGEV